MPSKLSVYRKKRDFKKTPEPRGKATKRQKTIKTDKKEKTTRSFFVIQQHAASHLHYDLRLKIGNVLKSWAIPKGPSMNPKDKRLAVETEDHPLEYAKFEGIIPEGHYGAGCVLLWDKGFLKNCTLSRNTKDKTLSTFLDLKKAYKNGHIIFEAKGKKLQGKFVLQRFRTGEKPAWIFIKMQDKYADTNTKQAITKTRPESIVSGLTLKEMKKPTIKKSKFTF